MTGGPRTSESPQTPLWQAPGPAQALASAPSEGPVSVSGLASIIGTSGVGTSGGGDVSSVVVSGPPSVPVSTVASTSPQLPLGQVVQNPFRQRAPGGHAPGASMQE